MYCPHCGRRTSSDHRFCRSCGFSLDKVSKLIAEQLPAERSQSSIEGDERFKARQQMLERIATIGGVAFIGSGAIAIVILIYFIISRFLSGKGEDVLFAFVLLPILIGAVLMLTYVFFRDPQKGPASRNSEQSATLPRRETNGELLLEPVPEAVSSVTEHTTELLEKSDAKDSKGNRSVKPWT